MIFVSRKEYIRGKGAKDLPLHITAPCVLCVTFVSFVLLFLGTRRTKNASGRSVRFRPYHYLLETTSANTQFGHSFDKWDHRFLVSNANHILKSRSAGSRWQIYWLS